MTSEKKSRVGVMLRAILSVGLQQGRRSGVEATTSEKKSLEYNTVLLLSVIERMVIKDHPLFHTHWQIACIMRRAGGLTYSDTPASGWQTDGTPEMLLNVYSMVATVNGENWDRPESVSKELYRLRYSLRDFKQQLLSIDKQAAERFNQYADQTWQQFCKTMKNKYTTEEFLCKYDEFQGEIDSPHHQTPIETALEQMDRLEEGLICTLKDFENEARGRKDMGQSRTYAAKIVALTVAEYMYEVNGKIPGLWTGEKPSGPYAKAVLEIFDLLDIPHSSLQRAGEWATAKLRSNPEF